MKECRRTRTLRAGAAVFALSGVLITISPFESQADERERDDLRQAVIRGEIHSLADILASVRSRLPGEIVGVKVEREDGRWFYEFRVVGQQGRLFEIYVDARTSAIERTKEK